MHHTNLTLPEDAQQLEEFDYEPEESQKKDLNAVEQSAREVALKMLKDIDEKKHIEDLTN